MRKTLRQRCSSSSSATWRWLISYILIMEDMRLKAHPFRCRYRKPLPPTATTRRHVQHSATRFLPKPSEYIESKSKKIRHMAITNDNNPRGCTLYMNNMVCDRRKTPMNETLSCVCQHVLAVDSGIVRIAVCLYTVLFHFSKKT